jgi:hypothetical protein
LRAERAKYLGLLAHWCGCPPRAVDELTVPDFILLVSWIDRRIDAQ